jgi:hypothetical protein
MIEKGAVSTSKFTQTDIDNTLSLVFEYAGTGLTLLVLSVLHL